MGWTYTLDELAEAVGEAPLNNATPFSGVSTDTRTLRPGDIFFALQGENFDGNAFVTQAVELGAAAVVSNTSVDDAVCITVESGLTALQDFAAYHRVRHPVPLIAITGSCGKTSSKDFIAAVLSEEYAVVKTPGNLNNEIGVPRTLLTIDADTDMAVVEMGANHPGEIARLCEIARPTESAITMIGAGHLEGFGTVDDVARAKGEIVSGLSETGVFYMNMDDPRCRAMGDGFGGTLVRYGAEGDVILTSCTRTDSGELRLEIDPVGELILPLPARAYAQNALLAVAVGLRHGIRDFQEPLRRACESASRMKVVTVGAMTVLDDTYNANPDSMRVALEALVEFPASGKRVAVLGEMGELGEASSELHASLGTHCGEFGVDAVLARGTFANRVVSSAKNSGVPFAEAYDTHEDMAVALIGMCSEGDTVLCKGSRSTTMEKIIHLLREKLENAAASGSNEEG
jgi:UDP-N-acetylmuramoyl-tripeptide--D-alanyl-D-alanine ligase